MLFRLILLRHVFGERLLVSPMCLSCGGVFFEVHFFRWYGLDLLNPRSAVLAPGPPGPWYFFRGAWHEPGPLGWDCLYVSESFRVPS